MSTPIQSCAFRMGTIPPTPFNPDCVAGDWRRFQVTYPAPPLPSDNVRVIVTAATPMGIPAPGHGPAVVPIIEKPNRSGFTLWARNSDCAVGSIGFNWLVVLETPGVAGTPVDLRLNETGAQPFQPDCIVGDWMCWGVAFAPPFPTPPVVLLTATAKHVGSVNHPAVVGTVRQPTPAGFTLAARNSDCVEGGSAFFWLALAGAGRGVSTGLVVDSGATAPPKSFAPDCVGGDWQSWTIAFSAPFGSLPLVLVTGNNAGVEAQHIGVVGTVRDVTTTGFTLKARNSDCASGQAGFFWVAIGGAVLEPTAMPMGQCIT